MASAEAKWIGVHLDVAGDHDRCATVMTISLAAYGDVDFHHLVADCIDTKFVAEWSWKE